MTRKEGKILFIGNPKEFLISSIRAELEKRGYETDTCLPTIDEVNISCESAKIALLFIEAAGTMKELFIFLKDNVFEKRVGLVIIGEKLGLNEALDDIGRDNVEIAYERPVNARQVSDGIEEIHKKLSKNGGKKSILIIDDEPEFLRHTQQLLHNHYKVYIANSGASAMMLLAKHKTYLILLDYMMPVINGEQVLEMLKSEPDVSGIPVIFLTGTEAPEIKRKALESGAENYLYKNTSAEALAAHISDLFAKKEWERRHPEEAKRMAEEEKKKNNRMECIRCLLGRSTCPLKQEGSFCKYEELGLDPPEGRTMKG